MNHSDGVRRDRIAGVMIGMACGDALGAGYEFQRDVPEVIGMIGGGLGPFEPGEWTDDTSMAIAVLEGSTADEVAAGFLRWFDEGPKDVGIQTSAVLRAGRTAQTMTAAAHARFDSGAPSAGNGSLMRTAPIALAHLDDPEGGAAAAREISGLTHGDPQAGEACVLWVEGVRRAIVDGTFDGVRAGLDLIEPRRRDHWAAVLDEAEASPPRTFIDNGYVLVALQAAYSAVMTTRADEPHHFRQTVEAAVRVGNDTDTVGAIAGALLGARWGASAVPEEWSTMLHGWPGYTTADLERLSLVKAGVSSG